MPAPYSNDLRQRIILAIEQEQQTFITVAKRFKVSYDFVRNLWRHYQTTGRIEPKKIGGHTKPKVNEKGETAIKDWLKEQPDLTLLQLCERYEQQFGVTLGKSSMDRALKRAGLSFKKKYL